MAAPDPFLEDGTSTVTVYSGTAFCRVCGQAVDPLTVAYNGDICTPDKRRAQRALVMNKRVGSV